MSDFIREVDEDYRRDRAAALLRRYQVPIVLLVVAVIGGAGGWRWWMDSRTAAAQRENARYVAAQDLAKSGKPEAAVGAFDAIATSGAPGYAVLARMRAAEVQGTRDPEAAAKSFDAIAEDATLPASMRETARFRGALLRVDHSDPKAFEDRYGRFADPGFAYHASMRELLALAALKRGDAAAARRYLLDISTDFGAPTALRNRAEAFSALAAGGPTTPLATQPPPAQVTPLAPSAAPAPPAAAPAPAAGASH